MVPIERCAGGGVELGGRLVGEQHARPPDGSGGEGDPLLLAAGQLGREACRRGRPGRWPSSSSPASLRVDAPELGPPARSARRRRRYSRRLSAGSCSTTPMVCRRSRRRRSGAHPGQLDAGDLDGARRRPAAARPARAGASTSPSPRPGDHREPTALERRVDVDQRAGRRRPRSGSRRRAPGSGPRPGTGETVRSRHGAPRWGRRDRRGAGRAWPPDRRRPREPRPGPAMTTERRPEQRSGLEARHGIDAGHGESGARQAARQSEHASDDDRGGQLDGTAAAVLAPGQTHPPGEGVPETRLRRRASRYTATPPRARIPAATPSARMNPNVQDTVRNEARSATSARAPILDEVGPGRAELVRAPRHGRHGPRPRGSRDAGSTASTPARTGAATTNTGLGPAHAGEGVDAVDASTVISTSPLLTKPASVGPDVDIGADEHRRDVPVGGRRGQPGEDARRTARPRTTGPRTPPSERLRVDRLHADALALAVDVDPGVPVDATSVDGWASPVGDGDGRRGARRCRCRRTSGPWPRAWRRASAPRSPRSRARRRRSPRRRRG